MYGENIAHFKQACKNWGHCIRISDAQFLCTSATCCKITDMLHDCCMSCAAVRKCGSLHGFLMLFENSFVKLQVSYGCTSKG